MVSVLGRAFEILKAMADGVYALGGTDEHIINAFVKDPERLAVITAIIVYGVDAAGVDHRNVYVGYVLPAFEQLNGTLFNWASNVWDGREWEKHRLTAEMDFTPRELIFHMKHFGKEMTDEQVITWADANGYRVANHLETLAYAQAFPEDQKKFWYVGLGSSAMLDSDRYVAYLDCGAGRRRLRHNYLYGAWLAGCRFLLVRK